MTMTTFNGERVSLSRGVPSIETIGISLGRIVRFTGHTEVFYTVLPHSLVVAALMPEEIGIYGLMHDAQESLVSDVPTPMKSQVARNREHVLQRRIYIAHGLPWPASEAVTAAVEEADHLALVAEANVLRHGGDWDAPDPEAARLTRKYAKKVLDWLNPEKSGPMFAKEFKRYYVLAGLNDTGEWQ